MGEDEEISERITIKVHNFSSNQKLSAQSQLKYLRQSLSSDPSLQSGVPSHNQVLRMHSLVSHKILLLLHLFSANTK